MSNRQKSLRLALAGVALVPGTRGIMKSLKVFGSALVLALVMAFTASAQNVNVTGSTGADGTYLTLGAAFTAINANTNQTGNNIAVAVVGDTNELAVTATLNQPAGGSWATMTITPTGTRVITGVPIAGSPLIDFSGADNVTISGGGTLTISNTTASTTAGTSTIRYINDATGNTVQNTTILGAGAGASTGNVIFSTTSGATGNDNNTVTGCNIGPAGAAIYSNGIFSSGTTTSQVTRNSGLQITNNNIFDFFTNTAIIANGFLAAGTTDATITGNSFYQTVTRTMAINASGFIGISIADTSSINNTVSNNFIGGSAASAGGTAWTQTGAFTHTFIGIRMSIGTATPSSMQNNVVRNLSLNTTSTSTVNACFSLVTGAINFGTTTGNTVGAPTGTGNITWTGGGTGGRFVGVLAGTGTPGGINISNNNIGSITIAGAGTTTFFGIRIESATAATAVYTVAGNTIGSTTTANSITSNSNLALVGISGTNTGFPATVSNNIVQNLQSTSAGTAASLRGIELTGTVNGQTISGNTVANFSTASTNTTALSAPAITGINFSGTGTTGSTITTNTIRDLACTAGAAAVTNQGIYIAGTPGVTISKNFIYNLTTVSTSTASNILGIQLFNNPATVNMYNNMMRLGTGVGNNPVIRGILDGSAAVSPTNIYFNSIFIDGTQTGATVNTAGIARIVASTMDIKDNIIWNNRASTGAPGAAVGRHYAIQNTSTGSPTSNGNDLYTPNNGGAIGFQTADRVTLTDWRTNTGQDLNSFNSDPMFIDATNATTPNLHINPAILTVVEGNGLPLATPTDDFDSQTRSTLTPVDIGADAGNFMGIDLSAPVITYTALTNTAGVANRVLSVTITDVTGVASGANLPRIYFKKSTDASYVSTQCVMSGGTAQNGTYNCTINYALIGGGSVTIGDTIQYFVVAQDTAGNLASNPSTGFVGTDVNTVTTPPTTPNTYNIVSAIGGSFNVGTGETFTSLTNAGGLFQFINSNEVTSNVTINITTDLAGELGTVALNEIPGGFTVLIRPSGAPRAIATSAATSFIKLAGADGVTIDGSLSGGTDRSLTINLSGAGAMVWIATNATSGANNNTVKNTIMSGPGAFSGQGIIAGSGAVFGNPAEFPNSSNTMQNNAVSRVQNALFASGSPGTPDQNWTVVDNTVGSAVAADKMSFRGFLVGNAQNFLISRNTISGVLSSTATSSTMSGIRLDGVLSGTISRNVISDIKQVNTTGWGSNGIYLFANAGQNVTIVNNFISDIASQGFNGFASTDNGYGIAIETGSGYNIWHNTIVLNTNQGATAAAGQTGALNILPTVTAAGAVDLRNNIFMSTQTLGTRFGVIDQATAANLSNSNGNDYFAQNVGRMGVTTQTTLLAWQGATGQDAASVSVDPLFVTPTDFHLSGASTLQGAALNTLLALVPGDIDTDLRDNNPDIGADEIPTSGRSGTIPAGTYRDGRLFTSTLGGNVDFTGVLTLNGTLDAGAFTLGITCTGSVVGPGPGLQNYVIGNVRKDYCGTGLFSFPVGTTANGSLADGEDSIVPEGSLSEYTPLDVNVTAGTFPSSLTVSVTDAFLPGLVQSNAISRHWDVTESGDLTANMTLHYLDAPFDVNGDESQYKMFKYTTGPFAVQVTPNSNNPGANTVSVTGVSSFSKWGAGAAAPTASTASISGRVTTANGNGIRNAAMILTSNSLSAPIIVQTGSFGSYSFDNLRVGETYVLQVGAKRFRFTNPTHVITLQGDIADMDFVANPQE
jgi:hypothetical protein